MLSLGVLLVGCRGYDEAHRIADQDGLVPPDVFARYGHEQAITVALGREFARPYNSGPEKQVEVVSNYARGKFSGDIVELVADPRDAHLTAYFKSGWRATVVPIDDGKTGDDTPIPGTPAP